MGHVEERLAAAGAALPEAKAPVGAYVPAVVSGALAYTSGQLPLGENGLLATGVVGGGPDQVHVALAQDCARQATLNALAALKGAIGDLDRVTQIVKVTGFIASAPGFNAQPSVLNAASDLLYTAFGEAGHHARSAVGVAALPLGAPIEVELVAAFE
jgi:enamine deaminase RidA (YjgF/YER057c/UK114 family)